MTNQEYIEKVQKEVAIELQNDVNTLSWKMIPETDTHDAYILLRVEFKDGSGHVFQFEDWRFAMEPFFLSNDVDIIVNNVVNYMKQNQIAPYESDVWEFVSSKSVRDSDGFFTEYTLYYNTEEDRYVCIFGDSDLYDPTNTEPDFECEEKWEAFEWFNDYVGPGDDEDEYEDDDWMNEDVESSQSIQSSTTVVHKMCICPFNSRVKDDVKTLCDPLDVTYKFSCDEDADSCVLTLQGDSNKLGMIEDDLKSLGYLSRRLGSVDRYHDREGIESSESVSSEDLPMNATQIVVWMYDNYPDWAFYDEHELNDGRIQLKFELGPKHQRADLEEDLDAHHVSYVIRNQLNIFAEEDPSYAIEDVESSTEVYDELPEDKYWYFTTHGVQPGSVPKGLIIEEVIDKPEGSYFSANRVISTDALKYYDIKERCPEGSVNCARRNNMKRYIRARYNKPEVKSYDWNEFIKKIEDYTGLKMDDEYKKPIPGKTKLVLVDDKGIRYTCSYTKYRDGELEFNDDLAK